MLENLKTALAEKFYWKQAKSNRFLYYFLKAHYYFLKFSETEKNVGKFQNSFARKILIVNK